MANFKLSEDMPTALDPSLTTSGMAGQSTNKDLVGLLISNGQLTTAGQSLADALPQIAPQMKYRNNGELATHPSAAHWLANVPANFTNEQYFSSFINHVAELWRFYQKVLQQQVTAPKESAPPRSPVVPKEKLVRRDGYLSEAGMIVCEYLDEQYLANRLPISQSTRIYVAHRFLMQQKPEKVLRDNFSIHAGLVEVFWTLAQRELADLKAEFAESKGGG